MLRAGLLGVLLVSLLAACDSGSQAPRGRSPRPTLHLDVANEPEGWEVIDPRAVVRQELTGFHGQVLRPRPGNAFLVVGLALENLTGEEKGVPTAVALNPESGAALAPDGFGEGGKFCVSCRYERTTSDARVLIGFVFELAEGDMRQRFTLRFGQQAIVEASPGWRKVEPGGMTACGRGGEYAFWTRRASPEKLLIFFQGGGGCFDYRSCAPESEMFKSAVFDDDHPAISESGILDFSRPANPFRDYSMVFIPSCTGDVHWGDNAETYRSAADKKVTVQHRGFANATSALRWAYQHVPAPRSIFVAGCSAGSVGSAAHAPYVIEHYPEAAVTQLGDSLAFVFHRRIDLQEDYRAHENFPGWIPEVRRIKPGDFTMADYYNAIADYYPDHVFGQVNYDRDEVQELFYEAVGGDPKDFPAALRASLEQIRSQSPNFRSYTISGTGHCVLDQDTFYTTEVDGVRLRDWVGRLAGRRDVENVGA